MPRAILLLVALALAGCGPRLLQWGWDEPDQRDLLRYRLLMERSPFDGVILRLTTLDAAGRPHNFAWEAAVRPFPREELAPAVADLKAAATSRLRHHFLRVNLNPADRPFDLFDDAAWATLTGNLVAAARAAREADLAGLLLDPEAYSDPDPGTGRARYNVFDYTRGALPDRPFAAYREEAFRRGFAVVQAVGGAHPEVTLLLAFAYSGPCLLEDGELSSRAYGLLPAFVDGMLAARPSRMRIVDGFEPTYGARGCGEFAAARRALRDRCAALSLNPERLADLEVAFGLWMDYRSTGPCARFGAAGQPCPWYDPLLHPESRQGQLDPGRFREAVAAALALTDGYVWIYAEQPRWWTTDPREANLPEAYAEAVRAARRAAGAACREH
ncbi:MAG: hypothetical protein L0214_01405 [candidate division NC10 bacterium]|nr:hypothetical protein [candidate division NC10 bacterium]